MTGSQSSADSSATTPVTDGLPGTNEYDETVYRECELCESVERLTLEYGMYVCADCDERLLP